MKNRDLGTENERQPFSVLHSSFFSLHWRLGLILAAVAIALASALPFASGWNDGSRLATVECLVDHGEWAIDDSIFVKPSSQAWPYHSLNPFVGSGTLDKLWIGGRWFSDKSPAPALWLALCYWVLQMLFGLSAHDQPGLFCSLMTLASSGLAYVVAVAAILRMTGVVGLVPRMRVLVTASFGLATLALVYVRWTNNHVAFLAVTSLLTVQLAHLARRESVLRWALVGLLASAGYCLDLGAGPALVLALAGLAAWRRRVACVLVFLAASFPLFALHHILNYQIGGTLTPANAQAAYVQWPGSPFDNMTGGWRHASVVAFVVYAFDLLVGRHGFFLNNLPMLLVPAAAVVVARCRPRETPMIVCLAAGCCGMWMVYAIGSTNLGGGGVSIRWFLPMIAPAYLLLSVALRECDFSRDLVILSIGGFVLMAIGWSQTLWIGRMIPGFWVVLVATLLVWAVSHVRFGRTFSSPGMRSAESRG